MLRINVYGIWLIYCVISETKTLKSLAKKVTFLVSVVLRSNLGHLCAFMRRYERRLAHTYQVMTDRDPSEKIRNGGNEWK